jgi:hypothetical protein
MDYLSKSKGGAKCSAEHARTEMSSESAVKATAVATARSAAAEPAAPSCVEHASTEMNAVNAARAIADATASSAEVKSTLTEPSGRRQAYRIDARY